MALTEGPGPRYRKPMETLIVLAAVVMHPALSAAEEPKAPLPRPAIVLEVRNAENGKQSSEQDIAAALDLPQSANRLSITVSGPEQLARLLASIKGRKVQIRSLVILGDTSLTKAIDANLHLFKGLSGLFVAGAKITFTASVDAGKNSFEFVELAARALLSHGGTVVAAARARNGEPSPGYLLYRFKNSQDEALIGFLGFIARETSEQLEKRVEQYVNLVIEPQLRAAETAAKVVRHGLEEPKSPAGVVLRVASPAYAAALAIAKNEAVQATVVEAVTEPRSASGKVLRTAVPSLWLLELF